MKLDESEIEVCFLSIDTQIDTKNDPFDVCF